MILNIKVAQLVALLNGRTDKEIDFIINNVSFLLSQLENEKLK